MKFKISEQFPNIGATITIHGIQWIVKRWNTLTGEIIVIPKKNKK